MPRRYGRCLAKKTSGEVSWRCGEQHVPGSALCVSHRREFGLSRPAEPSRYDQHWIEELMRDLEEGRQAVDGGPFVIVGISPRYLLDLAWGRRRSLEHGRLLTTSTIKRHVLSIRAMAHMLAT